MSTKTTWVLDPAHSEIAFRVKHLMITNVKGVFKEAELKVDTVGNDFSTADIQFSLSSASIDTGNPDRDAHLRSADFFDVENHKSITFNAASLKSEGGDDYKLSGDLTIKGISKKIELDVEFGGMMSDPWGNEKAGFSISGKINRKDWGLNWNAALEAGGVLVSDEVKILCEVQLLKLKQA